MGKLLQSDLFNVSEIEQINKDIKQRHHDEENLKARKNLNLPYYDNPQNDNERLLNYQYLYLKNNDMKAWGELISLAFIVTKRLIWRWMKVKKIQLDDIEQDEKTSIAVEYVLRRYKTLIGYCIEKNYISALKDGVRHAMLYRTKLDRDTVYIEDVFEVTE